MHSRRKKGGLRKRIYYSLWRIPARPRLFAALGARLFPRAPSRSFPRPCATRRTFREELTDWKAHWSRFSHFSLKSTSMPPFMSARIRSAPTSSYCGATGRGRSRSGEKKGDGKTNASEAMPRSEDDLFPNTPYTFQNLTLTSSSFL